ncbi:MAG: hypothetical protein HQL87_17730 [Magnetococcales bacterium]|nr:hypothetical protein [Magnetococcales bacterium]
MLNALPDVPNLGTSHPSQHSQAVAAVAEQIRTNGSEQVQAHHVEKVQPEGNAIQTDQRSAQARAATEELLQQRTHPRPDVAVTAKPNSQEQATAAMRRAVAAQEVRDGPVAGGTGSKVDVST